MSVFVSDPDFTLHQGDVREVLRGLPAESVHCCVTSPPYWGLRDYGADGQLGLEATPEEYVTAMVAVFREVRRVLRDDGTLWLNLGDSYAAGGNGARDPERWPKQSRNADGFRSVHAKKGHAVKPKDLVGIPWRVAFALQADGWYLRSDIIWAKPNPMPESVTDRPTKAHEYLFLLTKSARYFYDADAIREAYGDPAREWWNETTTTPGNPNRKDGGGLQSRPAKGPDGRRRTGVLAGVGSIQHRDGERWPNLDGRNRRSVWTVATEAYPDAHFAVFPQALVEPCIRAGCPEQICVRCGKARERVLSDRPYPKDLANAKKAHGGKGNNLGGQRHANWLAENPREHAGWSDCGCGAGFTVGTVLDPFMGSGTTALVARRLGRKSVGVELNESYCELAARRLGQQSLLADSEEAVA